MIAKTISIDAMGGDIGPPATIAAGIQVLKAHPDVHFIFVGIQAQIEPLLLAQGKHCQDRWSIHHASETVAMDEPVAQALRQKKDSSMRVAINLVKQGRAQACVSAGNTGALMATARFVLKTLPGIDRPAIITRFPTQRGSDVRLLDLGANVGSTAEHLFQFAVMGSVLTEVLSGRPRPTVGLLNIGEEQIKGTDEIKSAGTKIAACSAINYVGFIEGDDIFTGTVDVVVCDGFVGNVALKACEGMVKLVTHTAKGVFLRNWLSKLSLLPAKPVFKRLMKLLDTRRHNGATLLGLDGIVIKSHGGADALAFSSALEEAIREVEKNVPEKIRQRLQEILTSSEVPSSND